MGREKGHDSRILLRLDTARNDEPHGNPTQLRGVVSVSATQHHRFDINFGLKLIYYRKAQYEKKFKEWKFPKNLSKEERKYILHKKHQRDEAGKESAITWHSSVVPPQKLRRLEYEFSISELHQIRFGKSSKIQAGS
jgi:hypothetical protein